MIRQTINPDLISTLIWISAERRITIQFVLLRFDNRAANNSEYTSHMKRSLWHEPKNMERINAWLIDKGKYHKPMKCVHVRIIYSASFVVEFVLDMAASCKWGQ